MRNIIMLNYHNDDEGGNKPLIIHTYKILEAEEIWEMGQV